MVFTSLRFTLAAAAFTPFIRKGLANPAVRKAGMEIGMWTALGYLAQSWALSLTPASRASLLSTFTVIAVPCLAGLSGQKVKPLVWACGLAALVGTTLLEQGGGEPPNVGECVCVCDMVAAGLKILNVVCLAGLSGQKVKPLVWACGLAALVGTTLLEQGSGEPPNVGECVLAVHLQYICSRCVRF